MKTSDLRFPLLALGQDTRILGVYSSADELTNSNEKSVQEGYYNGLRLIDTDGRMAVVREARMIGPAGGIGLPLLRIRKVRVEPHFNETFATPTLSNIKAEIVDRLKINEGFWNETTDFEELLASIRRAASWQDLMLPDFRL